MAESEVKILTMKMLGRMEACDPAKLAFSKKFSPKFYNYSDPDPDAKAKISEVVSWLQRSRYPEWEAWMLGQSAKIAKAFLANGSNINADKAYALCIARRRCNLYLFKYLINQGIDVMLCEKSWNIMRDVCINNQPNFLTVLLETNKYSIDQVERCQGLYGISMLIRLVLKKYLQELDK